MKNLILPEFQEFLSGSNLVHKKYIPFYAYWSRIKGESAEDLRGIYRIIIIKSPFSKGGNMMKGELEGIEMNSGVEFRQSELLIIVDKAIRE
jgi:hypothetical protein